MIQKLAHLCLISIHALLAESDRRPGQTAKANKDFYPRSPCGERRPGATSPTRSPRFLSTLSLRRATNVEHRKNQISQFLSTLSLRRATPASSIIKTLSGDFYPRSPCGERPAPGLYLHQRCGISIHALLAESDKQSQTQMPRQAISIHALLAESDFAVGR